MPLTIDVCRCHTCNHLQRSETFMENRGCRRCGSRFRREPATRSLKNGKRQAVLSPWERLKLMLGMIR